MTAGSASTSRLRYHKIKGDLPITKDRSGRIGQLGAIGGVGLVAGATAPPFTVIDHMNIVEIPVAVTEFGVDGGIGEAKQIFIMTFEAETIRPFRIGSVVGRRVRSRQQSIIIRTMGVVTAGASSQGDGAVELRLTLQFLGYIFYGRKLVVPMTAKAEGHFVHGEEFPDVGGVRRMAGAAPPLLGERLVQFLDLGQLGFYGLVAFETEFGHLPDTQIEIVGTMRVMTRDAAGNLDGGMDNFRGGHQTLYISMTVQAEGVDGTLQKSLSHAPMRVMTGGASPRRHRRMYMPTGEGTFVVATKTESTLLFASFQEESAIAAMGLMAGDTVTVLEGEMRHPPRARRLMAGGAKFRPLGHRGEPLLSRERMPW